MPRYVRQDGQAVPISDLPYPIDASGISFTDSGLAVITGIDNVQDALAAIDTSLEAHGDTLESHGDTLLTHTSHVNNTLDPHGATTGATANTLMRRGAAGRSDVATPSTAANIANKGYVDTTASATTLASGTFSGTGHLQLNIGSSHGFKQVRLIAAGQTDSTDWVRIRLNNESGGSTHLFGVVVNRASDGAAIETITGNTTSGIAAEWGAADGSMLVVDIALTDSNRPTYISAGSRQSGTASSHRHSSGWGRLLNTDGNINFVTLFTNTSGTNLACEYRLVGIR
jgi:hypothetical protein